MIEKHKNEIVERCSETIIEKMYTSSKNYEITFNWHEWSVYDKRDEVTGVWKIPHEISIEKNC